MKKKCSFLLQNCTELTEVKNFHSFFRGSEKNLFDSSALLITVVKKEDFYFFISAEIWHNRQNLTMVFIRVAMSTSPLQVISCQSTQSVSSFSFTKEYGFCNGSKRTVNKMVKQGQQQGILFSSRRRLSGTSSRYTDSLAYIMGAIVWWSHIAISIF